MKKIILFLIFFSFMSTILAYNVKVSDAYTEIDLDYIIPENYESDVFLIKTDSFDSLANDRIRLNINVINNSNDAFEYRDYSFRLIPTSDNDYSKILFSFDAEYNNNSLKNSLDYINNYEIGNPFFKANFSFIENKASLKGIRIDKDIEKYDLYLEFILDRIKYE